MDKKMDIICSICQEAINDNDCITTLSCGHKFHMNCLIIMMTKTTEFSKCPNCRSEYDTCDIVSEFREESDLIKSENTNLRHELDLHQNYQNNYSDDLINQISYMTNMYENKLKIKCDEIENMKQEIEIKNIHINNLEERHKKTHQHIINLPIKSPINNHHFQEEWTLSDCDSDDDYE